MKLTEEEIKEAKIVKDTVAVMLACIPNPTTGPMVMAITTTLVEEVCQRLHVDPQSIVDCIKEMDKEENN